MSSDLPPLLGANNGSQFRVHLQGNSVLPKTTLGAQLAEILDVPHISLDTLFWKPGWAQSTPEEFQARIRIEMARSERGWVIDGNYERKGGHIVGENATDVIWLDPPLILYFPRLAWRTFLRLFRLRDPCSPGCPESFRECFFSKESILWWCLSQHWVNRRRNTERFALIGIGSGSRINERKMRRLGGWGSEVTRWLNQVREFVKQN
ncbi:hypothetical protein DL96DRAFT_1467548 [Flagelloscypha sp. PMI_526]|nr:hypothetical protein DL96DRAFT_1467548 [Flagelloscypha sp. PMI_526]